MIAVGGRGEAPDPRLQFMLAQAPDLLVVRNDALLAQRGDSRKTRTRVADREHSLHEGGVVGRHLRRSSVRVPISRHPLVTEMPQDL